LLDENSQSARLAVEVSEPIIDSDGLLATAVTCELAHGSEMSLAIERGIAYVNAMAARRFQPGMGGRIFDRSRSCAPRYVAPAVSTRLRRNGKTHNAWLPPHGQQQPAARPPT